MTYNESKSESVNINNVLLSFNLYKLPNNFIFDSQLKVNSIFSLCKIDDCDTQVILGNCISIALGIVLTPPKRCKGLIIYDINCLTNNGTISMTSRGCISEGKDIFLYDDIVDGMQYVPAKGATGGNAFYIPSGDHWYNGVNGANGINRQSGGGGTGSGRNYSSTVYVGRGGYGTSFSGGSGSGASQSDGGGGWPAYSADDPDNGGKGTNGIVHSSNGSGYGQLCTSGQGNPINTYYEIYRFGISITPCVDIGGTGGLLIIYCRILNNNGNIQSNGGNKMFACPTSTYGCTTSGGASGGGSVNIFSSLILKQGTITATGGKNFTLSGYQNMSLNGGDGGNGCITIKSYKYLFNSLYRTNSNMYKNVQKQNLFEFEVLL